MSWLAIVLSGTVLLGAAPITQSDVSSCRAYVGFLTTLEKELSGINVATAPFDDVFSRVINGFRDEYFVPLMGQPLPSTTEKQRRDFILTVARRGCPDLSATERAVYRRWNTFVQPVFMTSRGTLGADRVVAGLAERQQLLAEMRKASREPTPTATSDVFAAMDREIQAATVSLRKLWPREEREILQTLKSRRDKLAGSGGEAGKQVTIASAITGPEGSRTGGRPTKADYVYIDAAMMNGANGNLEVMPVEEVFQWLYDSKYKCLRTEQVLWRGAEGRADSRQFGRKLFVIECRGDCRDIHYRIDRPVSAQQFHYGLSKPVPVLYFRSTDLAYHDFTWIFTRGTGASQQPPVMRIHTWSGTMGDQGAGCTLD
jgi:hypothetical protein